MNFKGKAKRLDDIDLPYLGSQIGVGEDEIHAVLDVETAGGGFDSEGRPKMLFEPHIFYKRLSGTQLADAVRLGLAYKSWGSKPYPKNSYDRLAAAMAINKTEALNSASWWLGQIMGFNHAAAGYVSAEAMVNDFLDDEETHLAAMVKFITTNGLDDELRSHDWAGFARGYNGSQYAKHGYHTKLEAAFKKWSRIEDTPFDAAPIVLENPVPDSGYPEVKFGQRGPFVKIVYDYLVSLGYSVGGTDDGRYVFGPLMRAGVAAFQLDSDLKVDGVVGPNTWAAMVLAQPKELRDNTEVLLSSRTMKAAGGVKSAATVQAVAGGGVVLAAVADAQDLVGQAQSLGLFVDWIPAIIFGLAVVALAATWYSRRQAGVVEDARIEDHVTGANLGR